MKVFIFTVISIISLGLFAQNNALILNDAVVVNITNGAVISVNQTNPAGIALTGTGTGYIQSEGETNRVAWHIHNGTGSYVVPYGVAATSTQIPMTYNVTVAGSNPGTLVSSTYATPADNTVFPSVYAPAVTNVDACYIAGACVNRSLFANDRFWVLRKSNWATDPTSNLTLTYRDVEFAGPNTITEANLLAQYWTAGQWNPGWALMIPLLGTNNAAANQVNSINGGTGNFFTWILVDLSNPLPVELVELRASCSDDQFPVIEWVTESETNNDYFTIQRSQDATNWEDVTIISGAGNSNSTLYYSFTDENASSGTNYYRLIQTDFDGTSIEAGIVEVRCSQSNLIGSFDMNVYSDYEHLIHVTFYADMSEYLIMQLFDMRGRLIWNSNMTSTEGLNHVILEIPPLEDATYMFNLIGNQKQETKKFFLQ